jgi:hypothetical protein
VLYNGGEQVETDDAWAQVTAERIHRYEEVMGGRPDHVVVQSWHVHPRQTLPDTDPSTLTGLINRYFGERTRIQGDAITSSDGFTVDGSLTTTTGAPVAGALEVGVIPLEGSQQVLERVGTVPAGAETAEVGFRINTEAAGPGEADIRIYEVGYYEDGDEVNRVADPQFEVLGQFDLEGVSVGPSDAGGGTMVRLTATPDLELNIGSDRFTVTPGAGYRFTVNAAIPESSAQAGYAGVFFFGPGEEARHIMPLAPALIPLAGAATGQSGEFALQVGDLAPGRYRLRITYRGDLDHWPTYHEQELIVE